MTGSAQAAASMSGVSREPCSHAARTSCLLPLTLISEAGQTAQGQLVGRYSVSDTVRLVCCVRLPLLVSKRLSQLSGLEGVLRKMLPWQKSVEL